MPTQQISVQPQWRESNRGIFKGSFACNGAHYDVYLTLDFELGGVCLRLRHGDGDGEYISIFPFEDLPESFAYPCCPLSQLILTAYDIAAN